MRNHLKFFILLFLTFSVLLSGEKIKIKQIDCLKGDDFIQLHFKASGMLPIPDIFYPEKGNMKKISLRMEEASLELKDNSYVFDSEVLKSLKITKLKEYSNMVIELKKKVPYKVYTNKEGLFLEFPLKEGEELNSNNEKRALAKNNSSSLIKLLGVDLVSHSKNNLIFNINLSDDTNYKVIPIKQNPARLAIDIENVNAKVLKQMVGKNNVKEIRGCANRQSTYRVVFDLDYLNNYSVLRGEKKLIVTFFDSIKVNSNKKNESPKLAVNKLLTKFDENKSPKQANIKAAKDDFFGEEESLIIQKSDITDEEKDTALSYMKKTIDDGSKDYSGEPCDFDFKEAELANVLKTIAKLSGLNIVVDPGVTGKITCNLSKVPWDQALELFLKMNGLDMILEGNILRIGRIDVLTQEAKRREALKAAQEKVQDLEVFTKTLSYAKVGDITAVLKEHLSPMGKIVVDARTNTLIISEIPQKIEGLYALIETLDSAIPQVSIEARIIETSTNNTDAFGIQWGWSGVADTAHGNQTSLKFPNRVGLSGDQIYNMQNPGMTPASGAPGYAINLPAQGRNFGTALTLGNIANTFNLDVAITTLQKKGKARVLSAPKTIAQSNKEAAIMQGKQIPVQTVQNNTVQVQYVAAALELKVTPQITAKGDVICDLDIKNNSADFSNLVNGIPPITTQSTKTTVTVRDGGTIVIGGLYKVESSENEESVPLVSKIPILGNLFKNRSKQGKKNELLIFVTPKIIK